MPIRTAPTPKAGTARWLRPAVAVALLAATVVAVLVLGIPHPLQIRALARSAGPAAPLLFVLGHTLVTVAPVPRTVFTLASGLLFGPVVGVLVSLTATTASALLAFVLVRGVGRDLVAPWLDRGALRRVDAHLAARGWTAVASLRLIPAVPFSVLNYCSALSSIRLRHYLLGTVLGIAPGSVAVVLLGDALTGTTSPVLLTISAVCAAVGVVGLIVDARTPVR